MNCMKCGKAIPDGQVFCAECLEGMAAYPIKPGTVVQLPTRTDGSQSRKPSKKKMVSPAQQVELLKKRLRHRTVVLLVLLVLAAAGSFFGGVFFALTQSRTPVGQNYSTTPVPQQDDNNVSRETFQ